MPNFADVSAFLASYGLCARQYPSPTPTVETAAEAVGCSPAEIAKTIVVRVGGQPLVVITAGDQRLLSSRLKQALGRSGKVLFPAADEVLRLTGYPPGGVSPFLLPPSLPLLLDRSLRRFAVVYPAAGDDRSAVALSVDKLLEITGAREVDVCTAPEAAAC